MTLAQSKPFDSDAQALVGALFRTCPPADFISVLSSYAPRSASERVTFHKYMGWALCDSGDNEACRPHLQRAIRLSDGRSSERMLTLGPVGHGKHPRAEHASEMPFFSDSALDLGVFVGKLLSLRPWWRHQLFRGHVSIRGSRSN